MIDSEGTDDTFLCSTNAAFHTEMMAVGESHPTPSVLESSSTITTFRDWGCTNFTRERATVSYCSMAMSDGPIATDYAQGPDVCASRGLGLSIDSILLRASVCHPSPKVRARTVCPEAGKEAISSGSEPLKALVRGLPLPRPPSFRVRLGCLPLAALGPVSEETANEVVS